MASRVGLRAGAEQLMDLIRTAKPKPPVGEFLLERRGKSGSRVTAEQKIMREAVRLDGHKCRVPDCTYGQMPVDPCHVVHRGSGGNPKGDRTTLESIFAGCRIHHGQYDRGEIDAKFIQKGKGTRGLMAWYRITGSLDEGRYRRVLIGISAPQRAA